MVKDLSKKKQEIDHVGVLSFGFFLILAGVIFAITPNLLDRIHDFVGDFQLLKIASGIYIPTPKSDHAVLYAVIFQFCLVFGIFQVFALFVRFILKDPVDKKASTFSSIIFWMGASWILSLLMLKKIEWFVFLGLLITLVGISMVIRNALILITRIFRT